MCSFYSFTISLSRAIERDYWPTEEWQGSTPHKQKMDGTRLDEMVEYIDENSLPVDSITIIRNGYIIFEEHFRASFPEFKHVVWSVTKSFTSAIFGIAFFEGYIEDVNSKVVDYFPEIEIDDYSLGKENITLANLLTMTAGFDWTDDINWMLMVSSENQIDYILNLPMIFEPWSGWNYDTGGTHLLSAIIQKAVGNTTLEYAKEKLFEPIGISDYTWDLDNQGYYYGGHGIYMTPRDMARFGYLYLNNGMWDGEMIIHPDWVGNSTLPVIDFSGGEGYGGLWWISYGDEYYAARGRHGQMIYVVPEHDIVAVVTAYFTPTEGGYIPDQLFENYVLQAIEGPIDETSISFFLPLVVGIASLVVAEKKRKR
ncbi:MAG: serine hydrolase [Asgard group archaeon]|nr:serine hydrolase [Asgard group archaeon]